MAKYLKKYSEERPWGKFEKFCQNKNCTVKILFIKANGELSLQYHRHRDEFWKIIQGRPKIWLGNKIIEAKKNDEFFIPRKIKHKAKAGVRPVQILEISFGKFDENDEVRIEDKYKRI